MNMDKHGCLLNWMYTLHDFILNFNKLYMFSHPKLLLGPDAAAFQELHLSHNEIRHRGVCTLLAVLAMHPKEVYPRQVEHLDEARTDLGR